MAEIEALAIAELLIEPVWNRNSIGECLARVHERTFNRTSMESKLIWRFHSMVSVSF